MLVKGGPVAPCFSFKGNFVKDKGLFIFLYKSIPLDVTLNVVILRCWLMAVMRYSMVAYICDDMLGYFIISSGCSLEPVFWPVPPELIKFWNTFQSNLAQNLSWLKKVVSAKFWWCHGGHWRQQWDKWYIYHSHPWWVISNKTFDFSIEFGLGLWNNPLCLK